MFKCKFHGLIEFDWCEKCQSIIECSHEHAKETKTFSIDGFFYTIEFYRCKNCFMPVTNSIKFQGEYYDR